jgi:hypothetical protein
MVGASITVVGLSANAAAPPTPAGWTQTFLDDFNGSALSGEWRHSEGTSYPGGPSNFGTGEVEVNSRNNAAVTGGNLVITAQGSGLGPWTSDRIETNRQDFQPPAGGKLRVEARLRLPEAPNGQSNGYWPAFWILGAPYRGNLWNWPTVGEIDIMENVSGLNRSWQTLHCGWLDPLQGPNICNETNGIGNNGSAGPCGTGTQACTKSFHTYTIDWSKADQSVTWYVDGRQVWRAQRGGNVPTNAWDLGFEGHGFFVILNVAIGGQMPANNGVPLNAATGGGGHMDADYVAVYTGGANAPAPGQPNPTVSPPTSPPASCTAGTGLLSQGRPATASSSENATSGPALAFDGNSTTRWSSQFSDPQWIQVDLGAPRDLSRVALNWEAAYGRAYRIDTSSDATNWTTRTTVTTGDGGVDDIPITGNARYVRMYGTQRATAYGYSLWSMEVYGACTPTSTPPSPSQSTPTNPFSATRYLQSGGGLTGTTAAATTLSIPSAGGGSWVGTPHSPLTFTATGLTGTFTGGTTAFDLFADAGTTVGNATQARVSYDLTGDGSWDRVETYQYLATDPVSGWEHYTQAAGLTSATGTLGNLANGQVRVEVWNAIGPGPTNLGAGNQSVLRLPYS